jgi:DNA-binding transcriptional ArsR family regulator
MDFRGAAERAGLSQPGVDQHLTALRRAGLCSAHQTGRYVLYARTAIAEAPWSATPTRRALLRGDPHTQVGGD